MLSPLTKHTFKISALAASLHFCHVLLWNDPTELPLCHPITTFRNVVFFCSNITTHHLLSSGPAVATGSEDLGGRGKSITENSRQVLVYTEVLSRQEKVF